MPLNIKAEIARRLDVEENELEPVLNTVVQRIRQQVAHYGYARLAGLGTFRGRNGEIFFEPDAVLSETVNLRFAGLEPIQVETPVEQRAEPAEPASSRWDERTLPEAHPLADFDDDFGDDQEDEEPEEVAISEVDSTPVDQGEFEERDLEEENIWQDQEAESEHPLGPVPGPAYEDAEFSLVEEQDDDEGPLPTLSFENEEDPPAAETSNDDSNLESAAMWAALGASDVEEDEAAATAESEEAYANEAAEREIAPPAVEDERAAAEAAGFDGAEDEVTAAEATGFDAADGSEVTAADDDQAAPAETTDHTDPEPTGKSRSGRGPDRHARPHERTQRDWPSEHTSSGLGREASRRNNILIGAGVIVLVAAAAITYFSLQPGAMTGTDATAQTETQQPADASGVAGETDPTRQPAGETLPEGSEQPADGNQTPVDAGQSEAAAPVDEPAVESTPLRSAEGIDTNAGGFTIVVFSETSQSSATDVVQRYRGEGFRSDLLSSEDGGVSRYRVGVGQFATLEEAVDARNQLAGNELPQDAWVHRLE